MIIKKATKFLIGFVAGIKQVLWNSVTNILGNIEAVILLSFAAIGITAMLSELPFTIALPMFIEYLLVTPMIIPVISITLVTLLVMTMKWRLNIQC